jgi:hypothetical protein
VNSRRRPSELQSVSKKIWRESNVPVLFSSESDEDKLMIEVAHAMLPAAVYGRRMPPSSSFAEATALVESALGELRDAEAALERQLADLRDYLRAETIGVSGSRPSPALSL